MKVAEKLELIERVAVELQQRYTFDDVDAFLSEFDVREEDPTTIYDSKRLYAKDRLKGINESELKKIAEELNLGNVNLTPKPPRNWNNPSSAKAFITHLAKDKEIATRLRNALLKYNIESFVAHEDVKPSEEWQAEIEKALRTMDFFISVHTEGFKNSFWCQQEIGFAFSRGVKIIPIKFEEIPDGFISKYQALNRGGKRAEDVAEEILDILRDDEKTKEIYNKKIAPHYELEAEIPF